MERSYGGLRWYRQAGCGTDETLRLRALSRFVIQALPSPRRLLGQCGALRIEHLPPPIGDDISTGGGSVVEEPGKTWLVFAFPKPILISPGETADHSATIVYGVFESFRWKDVQEVGYQVKVFDIDPIAFKWEPISNFGATGYGIELH